MSRIASQPQEAEAMTLETAMATIKELQAKMASVEKTLVEKDATIRELKAQEDGWLILTQNPLYDGDTMGLQFQSGMAFVPKTKVFPQYTFPVPKQEKLDAMTEKQRAKYEDDLKVPTAEKFVRVITSDFGYESIYLEGEEGVEKLKNLNATRAKERAEAQKRLDAIESATRLAGQQRY